MEENELLGVRVQADNLAQDWRIHHGDDAVLSTLVRGSPLRAALLTALIAEILVRGFKPPDPQFSGPAFPLILAVARAL